MAIVETSTAPTSLRAGDSYRWRVTYLNYLPADGWALSYKLVNECKAYTITSSTDGAAFVIALTSTDTSPYIDGTYNFMGFVTNGADRVTIHAESIEILPNLSGQNTGFDSRSPARITLDLLDAALQTLGTKAHTQSYSIDNKSVTFRNFEEFTNFRREMRREVENESNLARIASGKKPRNKISVVI